MQQGSCLSSDVGHRFKQRRRQNSNFPLTSGSSQKRKTDSVLDVYRDCDVHFYFWAQFEVRRLDDSWFSKHEKQQVSAEKTLLLQV